MTYAIRPVILCGGSGTRLWPLSRRFEPKQFQKLAGERTLFQDTMLRFTGGGFLPPVVLANHAQEVRLRVDLDELGPRAAEAPRIIIEPAMRSTAPAIAALAMLLVAEGCDDPVLVAPSDHRVGSAPLLLAAIEAARDWVEGGGIALFGIRPSAPETGFGYVRGAPEGKPGALRPVEAFIEKPDIERARELVADGLHTWNSGMFLFRPSVILAEMERYAPELLPAVARSLEEAAHEDETVRLSPAFAQAPDISIDYAVMERSDRLGVVPVSPGWDDLGSFESLWRTGAQDSEGNVVAGETVLKGVRRSYVTAQSRLVAVVGLSNIVVVETPDAVLVTSRALSQDVKKVAQHLTDIGHPAGARHSTRPHPGGLERVVDESDGCRLARVTVRAGQTLVLPAACEGSTRSLTVLSGVLSYADALVGPAGSLVVPAAETISLRAGSDNEPTSLVVCTMAHGRDAALFQQQVG